MSDTMDKLTSFFDTAVTNMPIYRLGIKLLLKANIQQCFLEIFKFST